MGVLLNWKAFIESWPEDSDTGFTSETRGAILFTLNGMLAYIKHKLESGARFVLLGQLMSDPIEGYFGQVCAVYVGFFMDARAFETILPSCNCVLQLSLLRLVRSFD